MGESIQHINLIYSIFEAIKDIVPKQFTSLILIDLPDSIEKPPQVIGGFRPDLYYCYDNTLIIGEAKTSSDFERKHSKEQYLSYMHTCANYNGNAYLFIAVPWTEYISAKNLFRRMKKKYEFVVRIRIVNELGRVGVI